NNDDGWRTASALRKRGVEIAAIIDSRPEIPANAKTQCPDARIIVGAHVSGTKASPLLHTIKVATRNSSEMIDADMLAISGGWNPDLGLTCHHGGRPVWNADLAAFVPGEPPPGLVAVGAANGRMLLRDCLADGSAAGRKAAEDTGFATSAQELPRVDVETFAVSAFWHVSGHKAFVDFQNDVTAD